MLTGADRRPWIVTCRRGDGLRLICFPYAGGGPSLFRGWPLELSQQVEVCAVQLPGREARMLKGMAVRRVAKTGMHLRRDRTGH